MRAKKACAFQLRPAKSPENGAFNVPVDAVGVGGGGVGGGADPPVVPGAVPEESEEWKHVAESVDVPNDEVHDGPGIAETAVGHEEAEVEDGVDVGIVPALEEAELRDLQRNVQDECGNADGEEG